MRSDAQAGALRRASQLLQRGSLDEAHAALSSIVEREPNNPEALGLFGIALAQRGDHVGAANVLERAARLNPQNPGVHLNYGNVLKTLRRYPEALEALNRAASLRPDHAPTFLERARLARALGNNPAALFDIENVLRLEPTNVDALALRVGIYRAMGKRAEALSDCDRVLAIDDRDWRLHNNRGVLLDELGRPGEALASFERSLELNPNNPDAFQNIGTALAALKRGDEAIGKYDEALALDPSNVATHNAKGAVLVAMRRFEEALESFDRAVAHEPQSVISNFHRSFALLAMGRLHEGFEAYEWRRRGEVPFVNLPRFEQPELQPGEDPRGKRLLLYGEQGLGDVVQYARFARSFADLGATVILAIEPALCRLVRSLGYDIEVVPPDGPPPAFDVACPLLSAPRVLGTTIETIPGRAPYLAAPRELCEVWRARLQSASAGLRVGLSWSGSAQYANDGMRSIAFERFRPILDATGVTFVSVQRDVRASDENAVVQAGVLDVRDRLTDFAETAALLSQLDLVITVDTSIAHLAGALGRPVWVLLSAVSDWRWLEHRGDSPWYPTARLFRQNTIGDWEPVFADVKAELTALAVGRRSSQ